jgi:hypothetical protein
MQEAIPVASKSINSSPEVILYIWEFDNAPLHIRSVVSHPQTCGWIAFICPGGPESLIDSLLCRWHSAAHPVYRYTTEDGGIVLASSHVPASG